MNTTRKLVIPFFVALISTTTLAEDGSNRALSGVSPAGAPPHIQSDRLNSKAKHRVNSTEKQEGKKDQKGPQEDKKYNHND